MAQTQEDTMNTMDMAIEREECGVALVKDGNLYRVVNINHRAGQVTSIAADSPAGGGQWYGRLTNSGIRYVSRARSRDRALRLYRAEVRARSEYAELLADAGVRA